MLAMTLRTQPGPGSQTEGYTHWVDIVACAPLAKTTVITEFKKKKKKEKRQLPGSHPASTLYPLEVWTFGNSTANCTQASQCEDMWLEFATRAAP